jgi:hypothetical protein
MKFSGDMISRKISVKLLLIKKSLHSSVSSSRRTFSPTRVPQTLCITVSPGEFLDF